ncbi:MAG: glycosyltransferase family 10 [Helicobacter sp.]|nr:glycosyltransferase family 10 [Helicobacter sp.]
MQIKLKIIDWWNEESFDKNIFVSFLRQKYEVINSEQPDFIICSCFGNNHLKYNCPKILYLGENIIPDFNLYDYAIGFHFIEFGDRYLRFPLAFWRYTIRAAMEKHLQVDESLLNRGFASFLNSNSDDLSGRRELFRELSKVDFVASGGLVDNNIGMRVNNKHEFVKSYKFNLAFENSITEGYYTEKIIDAFYARTVPIYLGDPCVAMHGLNPKAYINVSDFDNMQDLLDCVRDLHNDDDKYLSMMNQSAFLDPGIVDRSFAQMMEFFDNIFQNPAPKKIPFSMRNSWYMDTSKENAKIQEKLKIKTKLKAKILKIMSNVGLRGGGARL